MAFLEINGLTVDIADGEATRNPDKNEIKRESYNGNLNIIRKYKKRKWELQTTLLTADEIDCLQGLIDGEGHYFSFDSDLYSFKGLSPESGYDVTLLADGGKYSDGLQVNVDIDYDFGYVDDYTALFWRADTVGGTFHYYAFDSDSNKYYNGSSSPSTTINFASMSNGILTLEDVGSNDVFDDLIVVPYIMTADLISAIHSLGEAYSSLPRLKISGDMVNNSQIICEGLVNEQPYEYYNSDNNGQKISFTLFEV